MMRTKVWLSALQARIVIATACVLAGCGGGGGDVRSIPESSIGTAAQVAGEDPKKILAVPAPPQNIATPEGLLDWAQIQYPDLFSQVQQSLPAVEYDDTLFVARAYAAPDGGLRYLGVTLDGRVFGLGDFTNQQLQPFETLAHWSPQVCGAFPGACTAAPEVESPPAGPLNECTAPAATTLAPGRRIKALYLGTGDGFYPNPTHRTVETVVEGTGYFEGIEATKVTTTTSDCCDPFTPSSPRTTTETAYLQAMPNGYVRTMGYDVSYSNPNGSPAPNRRIVYIPGRINSEFSLAPGQALTKTTRRHDRTRPPGESSTWDESQRFTFEGFETTTVNGKSYETCFYREGSLTASYRLKGVGIPVWSATVGCCGGNSASRRTYLELVQVEIDGVPR